MDFTGSFGPFPAGFLEALGTPKTPVVLEKGRNDDDDDSYFAYICIYLFCISLIQAKEFRIVESQNC